MILEVKAHFLLWHPMYSAERHLLPETLLYHPKLQLYRGEKLGILLVAEKSMVTIGAQNVTSYPKLRGT